MDWRNAYGYFLIPIDPDHRNDVSLARRLYDLVVQWGEGGLLPEPSAVLGRRPRSGRNWAVLFVARSRSRARLPMAAGLRAALNQIAPVSLERAYPDKIRAWTRTMPREMFPLREFSAVAIETPAPADSWMAMPTAPASPDGLGPLPVPMPDRVRARRPSKTAGRLRQVLPGIPLANPFWSVRGICRQAGLILLMCLLLVLPAAWHAWKNYSPQYEAIAEVRVRSKTHWSSNSSSPQSDALGPFYESQRSVLRSSALVDRVLARPEIQQTAWYTQTPEASKSNLTTAERLRRGVNLERQQRSERAQVSFRAASPTDAQIVAAAVVEEWLALLAEQIDPEVEARYEELSKHCQSAEDDLEQKRSEAANLEEELGTAATESLVAQWRLRVDELESRLKDTQHKIAMLEWRTQQPDEKDSTALMRELRLMRLDEQRLNEEVAAQTARWSAGLAQSQQRTALLASIEQDQRHLESVYRDLETMQVNDRIGPRLELLAQAHASPDPVGRWRWSLIGVALLLSLPMGVLAGYWRHRHIYRSAWTAADLRQAGLPLLGTLSSRNETQASPDDPSSTFAEEMRLVRTGMLAHLDGQPRGCILVASASPQEGRTSVALGLAVSLARSGFGTLLVEADFRAPCLAKRLGDFEAPGLSELLAAQADEEQAIRTVTDSRLDALPAGHVYQADVEAEWLASDVFAECLQRWRQKYDYVILDSPAMAAVADGLILARLADYIVLVGKQGYCRHKDLGEVTSLLRTMGKGPLGIVLVGTQ